MVSRSTCRGSSAVEMWNWHLGGNILATWHTWVILVRRSSGYTSLQVSREMKAACSRILETNVCAPVCLIRQSWDTLRTLRSSVFRSRPFKSQHLSQIVYVVACSSVCLCKDFFFFFWDNQFKPAEERLQADFYCRAGGSSLTAGLLFPSTGI